MAESQADLQPDAQAPEALSSQYEPKETEARIMQAWLDSGSFRALPGLSSRGEVTSEAYVVMMPLPNVTGALHMGHAMDNVMQDLLVRRKRMMGVSTLWMPGTDHAGIATQAVVEKRLFELEGKNRHDIGREALVERIWDWKDQYQARIVAQQQRMGCSADWERQRFTMDEVCSRALRWTFFKMFRDGLIYRGTRLVNWDCVLQTAVSDDEIEYKTVDGFFYHLRYPVIDPEPGEPEFVTVATTRPETMLGDTGVACHPNPRAELERKIEEARERLERLPAKERDAGEAQLRALEERRETVLPQLETFVKMAKDGRMLRLPLADRPIPLVADEWAKPEMGSGCVKLTPGHDPNDYEVWQRQDGAIDILNILNADGTLNANAGPYEGMDRFDARERVCVDLEAAGLLELREPRETEIGHSDRSKSPIEPYLSLQWFVDMGDRAGGVTMGQGTELAFETPGLAQAAIDAAEGDWTSPTGKKVGFHPDAERYSSTYLNWLREKRDWCISRQLWWGHQIPIWAAPAQAEDLEALLSTVAPWLGTDDLTFRLSTSEGLSLAIEAGLDHADARAFVSDAPIGSRIELLACPRDEVVDARIVADLEAAGFKRDPDVLDTWFSSGIWPQSTLGWPDPSTAKILDGQLPLEAQGQGPSALEAYYPGSCLVTGRDIITLWVARMVIMGLYNMGDLPFTDVFLHANILDGKGERMSKSKGNGIDPVDILDRYGTDAMRYVLCEMQTGTQDVRLPVQAISPFTGDLIELADAKHGKSIFTYLDPKTGQEFDVLGTMPDLPAAKLISDRFTIGRNFSNKLWNAMRFALMNLEGYAFDPLDDDALEVEDRWILSRLAYAIDEVDNQLERYNPSAAITAARDFFWNDLCDWYLELIKPRLKNPEQAPLAKQVLATLLDQVLRLFHPFVPFITEALWTHLNEAAPERGIGAALPASDDLIRAAWPQSISERRDEALEARIVFTQEIVRSIRDLRNQYNVPPSRSLECMIKVGGESAAIVEEMSHLLLNMAGLSSVVIDEAATRALDAAIAVVHDMEVYVPGVVDLEKERARLESQLDSLAGRLRGLEGRLSNEAFLSKAKPEIVEQARNQREELLAQQASVNANLAQIVGQ